MASVVLSWKRKKFDRMTKKVFFDNKKDDAMPSMTPFNYRDMEGNSQRHLKIILR
jgi:hypothetical protein